MCYDSGDVYKTRAIILFNGQCQHIAFDMTIIKIQINVFARNDSSKTPKFNNQL